MGHTLCFNRRPAPASVAPSDRSVPTWHVQCQKIRCWLAVNRTSSHEPRSNGTPTYAAHRQTVHMCYSSVRVVDPKHNSGCCDIFSYVPAVCTGCEHALPAGYTGIIASLVSTQTDACPRVWEATSTFSKVTYWNHDLPPTATDPQRRALDWLELAGQVRACVVGVSRNSGHNVRITKSRLTRTKGERRRTGEGGTRSFIMTLSVFLFAGTRLAHPVQVWVPILRQPQPFSYKFSVGRLGDDQSVTLSACARLAPSVLLCWESGQGCQKGSVSSIPPGGSCNCMIFMLIATATIMLSVTAVKVKWASFSWKVILHLAWALLPTKLARSWGPSGHRLYTRKFFL